jgi:hypothetical protein
MAPDRMEHGLACTEGLDPSSVDKHVKFSVAPCDGKMRAVTVMSSTAQVLKPLHRLLYDHISKFDWLLRGEAKPSVFSSFTRRDGEVFVSGDYESATDHLPVTVAEIILAVARRTSRLVPGSVWDVAMSYLRVQIVYPDGITAPATRQLMGSLLCFPLLCLQNYFAFRWIFPASVPVRINGDDIVFRASREAYQRWASFVSSVGLRLSPGKTMVHRTFFSLNSTFFRATERYVKLVPVVRFTSLARGKCVFPNSLSGALRGFLKGFRKELRESLSVVWLRRRAKLIRKSGRSVTRGLGIEASSDALKRSGLWYRELWYFNSVPVDRFNRELALPQPPSRLEGRVKIPAGWKRVSAREARGRLDEEQEFFDELLDLAWGQSMAGVSIEALTNEYFRLLSAGGFEAHWQRYSRKNLRRNVTRRLFGAFQDKVKLPRKPFYSFRPSSYKKEVWIKDEDTSFDIEALRSFSELPFDAGVKTVLQKKKPIFFKYGGTTEVSGVRPADEGTCFFAEEERVRREFFGKDRPPLERAKSVRPAVVTVGPSVSSHLSFLRSRLDFGRCVEEDPEGSSCLPVVTGRHVVPPPDCLTRGTWLVLEEQQYRMRV